MKTVVEDYMLLTSVYLYHNRMSHLTVSTLELSYLKKTESDVHITQCVKQQSLKIWLFSTIAEIFSKNFVFEVNTTAKDDNLLVSCTNNSSRFMLLLTRYSSSISNTIYLNTLY
jgi:hypothetical protein